MARYTSSCTEIICQVSRAGVGSNDSNRQEDGARKSNSVAMLKLYPLIYIYIYIYHLKQVVIFFILDIGPTREPCRWVLYPRRNDIIIRGGANVLSFSAGQWS